MVPSPLLGLLPVIKTVQFEIVIAHSVNIEMSNENRDPNILKFLWQSIFLLINVRDPPDKLFSFIHSYLY